LKGWSFPDGTTLLPWSTPSLSGLAIEVNFEALPHGVLRLGRYTMSAGISQSRVRDDF